MMGLILYEGLKVFNTGALCYKRVDNAESKVKRLWPRCERASRKEKEIGRKLGGSHS